MHGFLAKGVSNCVTGTLLHTRQATQATPKRGQKHRPLELWDSLRAETSHMHTERMTSDIHVDTDIILGRTVFVVPGQSSGYGQDTLKHQFWVGPHQMPSEQHVHTGHASATLQTNDHGPVHAPEGKVG